MQRWLIGAALAAMAGTGPVLAQTVPPSPTWQLLPRTNASVPLGTAVLSDAASLRGAPADHAVGLARHGFVEEEYLVTGSAAGLPYATRLLVRRPAKKEDFFATVVIEPLREGDQAAPVWLSAWPYLTDHGDGWAGWTDGRDDVAALKKFDPGRYAALTIGDPSQRFEIAAQIAWLVQSEAGPFGRLGFREPALKVQGMYRVYAAGWGQSACTLTRFINEGHHARARRTDGRPVLSGYLLGGCPERVAVPADAAVMQVMTETDHLTAAKEVAAAHQEDGDKAGEYRFRWYDLAGVARFGWPDQPALSIARHQLGAADTATCTPPVAKLPGRDDFLRAMIANLDDWVRLGLYPPKSPPFERNADGSLQRDEAGRVQGGLRPWWIDVAGAPKVTAASGSGFCGEALRQVAPATGAGQRYKDEVIHHLDRLVRERRLLLADGEAERDQALK